MKILCNYFKKNSPNWWLENFQIVFFCYCLYIFLKKYIRSMFILFFSLWNIQRSSEGRNVVQRFQKIILTKELNSNFKIIWISCVCVLCIILESLKCFASCYIYHLWMCVCVYDHTKRSMHRTTFEAIFRKFFGRKGVLFLY